MADANDRVSIELIDAGNHKDQVVRILSKVTGLVASPNQIVSAAPCTVATNVPRSIAEKLKSFLEKAGAMIMLESEDDLLTSTDSELSEEEESEESDFEPEDELPEFAPDTLPEPDDEDLADPLEDELFGPDISDDQQPPPLSQEEEFDADEEEQEKQTGIFQKLTAALSGFGKKKSQETDEDYADEEEAETQKRSPLAFLNTLRKPRAADDAEEADEFGTDADSLSRKSIPDVLLNPVVLGIVGFFLGVVITGVWGSISTKSVEREWQQRLSDYETDMARQIEEHSAELKNQLAQLSRELDEARQTNADLTAEIETLNAQLNEAQSSGSPSMYNLDGVSPGQDTLSQAFQEIMAIHTQSLENSYDAQKQAPCSQQVLLDGQGTLAYAQVVKQFSSKYTRFDILHSDSLITPYKAELKIPFQQEMRVGTTEDECNAKELQQLPTPSHHEFGGYYGYWTIEYAYTDGKWVVNPTVIEKNRALYESSFQKGSPDYAKFRIDTTLFPEFKAE